MKEEISYLENFENSPRSGLGTFRQEGVARGYILNLFRT